VGIALVVAAAVGAACGRAQEPSKMFSLRGFGTFGAVAADVRLADYVGNAFQPDGAGFNGERSADIDSKLGVQVDARFSERWSAVVQVVAQHRFDGSYTPQIEWANLKFQATPEFSLRVGRTVADQFMFSDARLVSYISPWVRPPQEVYGMMPLTNKDGVDIEYRFGDGALRDTVRASYGQSTLQVPGRVKDGEVDGRDFFDLNNTLAYGPLSLRLGYSSARGDYRSADLNELFGGFTSFGQAVSAIPGLAATGARAFELVERYQLTDFPFSLVTVGASYDREAWLFMAEWASVDSSGLVLDASAWYATGGYRIGQFTPYLTYAQLRTERPNESGIATTGLPPPLAQAAAALNAGLGAALAHAASAQDSIAFGIRWDWRSNAAFKAQYDRIELGQGSSGRLANIQPGFELGSRVGVFSASIDFVF
jgi:hypothetical protein